MRDQLQAEWEELEKSHPIGTPIKGTVLRREAYGVWVDAGLGFPTLLEVRLFVDADMPLELDDYPSPGSTIEARIVGFKEREKQIYLTQQPDTRT